MRNCCQVNATEPNEWDVNIGNKPLPEPMLTQIYVAIIIRLQ